MILTSGHIGHLVIIGITFVWREKPSNHWAVIKTIYFKQYDSLFPTGHNHMEIVDIVTQNYPKVNNIRFIVAPPNVYNGTSY